MAMIDLRLLIAAALASAVSFSVGAQTSEADIDFMRQAASSGQLEIQASMLAEHSSQSDAVKEFARHMVTDHGQADAELKQLAQQKGVELTPDLSKEHRELLNDVNARQGEEFDRHYAAEIGVKAHQEAVELFEQGAKHANDDDVKAYAKKTLPTLKEHLDKGKELHEQIEKSAS